MDYIKISGYKSIKELDFKVAPINILIGANGAGKSNFISFFKFLNAVSNQQMQLFVANRADKFLYKGSKVTQKIKCHISFGNRTNEYQFELSPIESNFVIENEGLTYRQDTTIYRGVYPEAQVKIASAYRAKFIYKFLNELKIYHFHDVGANSPFITSCGIHDNIILSSNGHNLAAILLKLKNEEAKTYAHIISVIRQIAPYFLDFILEPDHNDNILLRWKEIGTEITYTANDFSDGTMRFIALAVAFIQPNSPATIIIDEPELGLHPVAIELLCELIKVASKQNIQVIAATQSAELINHFTPKDIIAVDRGENGSIFTRFSDDKDIEQWITEYSLGEIWVRNIIGKGQPY